MRLKQTAHVAVTAGLCTAMMLGSMPLTAIAEELVIQDVAASEQMASADVHDGEDQVVPASSGDVAAAGAFKIGDVSYASLKEAVDAVKNSTTKTIVLTEDASGNGVAVESGTDFTLDLGGHTYTIDGQTVGSAGTETNGFQLLQNSTITIKNGTIRSDKAAILIQNYSNLTLEKVQLLGGKNAVYTLSNNNGNTVIGEGARIVAGQAGPKVAFDVCGFSSYKAVHVTVEDGAVVEGDIELSSDTNEHVIKFDIEGGDLTKASLKAAGGAEKVQVKKAESVQLAAPEGHQWVGNQLVKAGQGKVAAVIGADGAVAQYAKIADALTAANGQTVTLLNDVVEDVVVGKGVAATIDLAGHTITNKNGHTVFNMGVLTVKDSVGGGTVDNVTNGRTAVYNEVGATAVLEAGMFSRSKEASKDENTSGGNTCYTLLNHGTMTIKDGVTVCQGKDNKGQFSSLVENGWYNGNQNTTKTPSVMVIEGGSFVGGLNTIKNDDYGQLTIKGGSFENVKQAAVLNWNVTQISGGTFDSNQYAVLNGKIDNVADKGELTITGGSFKAPIIVQKMSGSNNSGVVKITDGEFDGKFPAPEKIDGSIDISGGAFSDPSAEEFVVPGSGLELDENGNLSVAQVKILFASSVKDGVYTYDVKGGEASAIDLLYLVHLNVTNESGNYSVVLPDSSSIEALNKAVSKADISKVHEIKIQAVDGNKVVDEQVLKIKLTDSSVPVPVAKATVTFEPGVGDSFTCEVEVGSKLERPADPKRDGWEFAGWFTVKNADNTLSGEWDFENGVVADDMTLYGGWVKKGASSEDKPADKPAAALPKTGDASMFGVAVMGAAGTLAAAAGYVASKRRK